MPILNSQTVRNAFDDDYYLRKAASGDVSIAGNLAVAGIITDSGRQVYPGAVKVTSAGTITKQTTATLVPESSFTIPTGLDGYYSFTAQINLGGVGTVADGENFQLYLDVSGGSLTPINGTINILDMTENSANAFSQTPSGIIMQRLTAGQIIQLYHLEQGSYTFSSGSIQVAYTYLGDTAL